MSNDWIEHTGDTCPVDPETVVDICFLDGSQLFHVKADDFKWFCSRENKSKITHYRINGLKIRWPTSSREVRFPPEPDLITLRLECLKLAVAAHPTVKWNRNKPTPSLDHLADIFLHYVLNGSVDKA
jgi:hypothetical protein